VALLGTAGDRSTLLLLILGRPSSIAVAGRERLSLEAAIAASLDDALAVTPDVDVSLDALIDRLPETMVRITKSEIAHVTRRQAELF
jgi:hypothetical protein